jgi:ATP-dependent helicase/nuclease subunit B
MNNHSFENGSIIFSEPHAQTALLRKILEKSPVLSGVQILSLASYLRGLDDSVKDPMVIFCETAKICNTMRKQMEILGDMLKYPQTIQDIADFAIELNAYGVDASNLPEDDAKERDLKKLVLRINEIGLPGKSVGILFDELLSSVKSRPIYLSCSDENLLTSKRYVQLLVSGAKPLSFEKHNPAVHLFHAVNARTEALGIAQFIAGDPMKFNTQSIVCLDPAANLPVLKANFDRLNIPYSVLSESFVLPEADLFIRLLTFCEKKSIASWVDVLNTSAFNEAFPLVKYISDFGIGLPQLVQPLTHVQDALVGSKLWDKTQAETYLKMESTAERCRIKSSSILVKAMKLDLSQWKSGVEQVFRLCVDLCDSTDEGKTALLQIKSMLEKILPDLEGLANTSDLLTYTIQGLRKRTKTPSNGVVITDLNHFHLPGISRMFVISCSQKNFPQFEAKNGLIDENYRERTGLPSLKERYDAHMNRIKDLFSWTPELVFSVATGNYEGKSNELAFEIENFCQRSGINAVKWPISEENGRQKPEPVIKAETLKALLFPKGQLQGSVSAIERFFECPYKYFLSTGLKLRTKPDAKIEVNVIGTLMHKIFEHAVDEYKKDYPLMGSDEIQRFAELYFHDLRRMYPHRFAFISTLEKRMLKQLRKVFDRLAVIEAESSFIPYENEVSFKRAITADPMIQLNLGGYIDRIDKTATQLRIMDYKSSAKKLSLRKVLTGQQLQLLTYLWIASQDFGLEATGAYYISLKQENTNVYAGKLGLRPLVLNEHSEEQWKSEEWKNHRLKGWTFADPISLDQKGQNFDSLKLDKNDKVVVAGGPYRIDLVEKLMNELYAYFTSHLAVGDISRTCTPHACEYCDFVRLCQFRGETVNVKTRTSVKNLKKGD